METKYAFVCDCANVDTQGKLNVLGIFNNINIRQFPCTYGSFMYVAALEFSHAEDGVHGFRLCFIDYDGKDILPPQEGKIDVTNSKNSANLIVKIETINFTKEGRYRIDLAVDNMLASSVLINVIKRP